LFRQKEANGQKKKIWGMGLNRDYKSDEKKQSRSFPILVRILEYWLKEN